MSNYVVGTQLRLIATFTDVNGNLVDPTSVTLYVKDPTGSVSTIGNVIRQSIGVYYFDYSFVTSGVFHYRYVGAGAVVAANEGTISIKKSDVV